MLSLPSSGVVDISLSRSVLDTRIGQAHVPLIKYVHVAPDTKASDRIDQQLVFARAQIKAAFLFIIGGAKNLDGVIRRHSDLDLRIIR